MKKFLSTRRVLALASMIAIGVPNMVFAQGLDQNGPGASWGAKTEHGWSLPADGDGGSQNYGNQGQGNGQGNAGGTRPNQ